jgi:uncharacterized Tic20 family protein
MTSMPPRPWRTRGGPGAVAEEPGHPGATDVSAAEAKSATFGYLGAMFSGPVIPLFVYATSRKGTAFRHHHAATALNLSLTGLLYALCCLILCGMLLLDTLIVALVVTIPITAWLWFSVLRQLVRGSAAANRGEQYDPPAWICAKIAK